MTVEIHEILSTISAWSLSTVAPHGKAYEMARPATAI